MYTITCTQVVYYEYCYIVVMHVHISADINIMFVVDVLCLQIVSHNHPAHPLPHPPLLTPPHKNLVSKALYDMILYMCVQQYCNVCMC